VGLVSSPLCPTTLSFLQGFLAQGLSRTTAGLGSVIIDSQPLTVALLAALLFGETIGPLGALGLATGVLGLCLLEVSVLKLRICLKTSEPVPGRNSSLACLGRSAEPPKSLGALILSSLQHARSV
jgi:hypothetical protein